MLTTLHNNIPQYLQAYYKHIHDNFANLQAICNEVTGNHMNQLQKVIIMSSSMVLDYELQ